MLALKALRGRECYWNSVYLHFVSFLVCIILLHVLHYFLRTLLYDFICTAW